MDIKDNLAKNLIVCRKNANLTQAELAQKINYSDKAVSKWERGEAVPDLAVLKQIADLYETTIDELISDEPIIKDETISHSVKNLPKIRFIICLAAAVFVWAIAISFYAFIGVIFPSMLPKAWIGIIIAIPCTFTVLIILTSVWGKNLANTIFASLLLWTLILAVYISLFNFLIKPPQTLWMIFLIGIPIQFLIVLWFSYKRIK